MSESRKKYTVEDQDKLLERIDKLIQNSRDKRIKFREYIDENFNKGYPELEKILEENGLRIAQHMARGYMGLIIVEIESNKIRYLSRTNCSIPKWLLTCNPDYKKTPRKRTTQKDSEHIDSVSEDESDSDEENDYEFVDDSGDSDYVEILKVKDRVQPKARTETTTTTTTTPAVAATDDHEFKKPFPKPRYSQTLYGHRYRDAPYPQVPLKSESVLFEELRIVKGLLYDNIMRRMFRVVKNQGAYAAEHLAQLEAVVKFSPIYFYQEMLNENPEVQAKARELKKEYEERYPPVDFLQEIKEADVEEVTPMLGKKM